MSVSVAKWRIPPPILATISSRSGLSVAADLLQRYVARLVTVGIVDDLEVIQIHHDQSQWCLMPGRLVQQLLSELETRVGYAAR